MSHSSRSGHLSSVRLEQEAPSSLFMSEVQKVWAKGQGLVIRKLLSSSGKTDPLATPVNSAFYHSGPCIFPSSLTLDLAIKLIKDSGALASMVQAEESFVVEDNEKY